MGWFQEVKSKTKWLYSRLSLAISESALFNYMQIQSTQGLDYLRKQFPTLNQVLKTYEESYDARIILQRTWRDNLIYYAAPVILYEALKPTSIDNSSLDRLVQLYFWTRYGAMFINNTFYTLALAKAISPYVVPCKHKEGCDCDSKKRIQASLLASAHYVGNSFSASLVAMSPRVIDQLFAYHSPLLDCSAQFLKAAVYGYSFVGMKYSAHQVCAADVVRLLNNNRTYCLLVGASFVALLQQFSYYANTLAGTEENIFIEDAVFNSLFPVYLLFSTLQVESLGLESSDSDLFYYQRHFIDRSLLKLTTRFFKGLDSPAKKDYTKRLNHYLNFRLVKMLANTTAISLYLDVHQSEIKRALHIIIEARGYPLWVVDCLTKIITPKTSTIIVNILKQEGWEDTQKLMDTIIKIAVNKRDQDELYTDLYYEEILLEENYFDKAASENTSLRLPASNLSALITGDHFYSIDEPLEIEEKNEESFDLISIKETRRRHSWSEGLKSQATLFAPSTTRKPEVTIQLNEDEEDYDLVSVQQPDKPSFFSRRLVTPTTQEQRPRSLSLN